MRYLLDSNVLIDLFRQKPTVERFFDKLTKNGKNELGYGMVTEVEIFAGVREGELEMTEQVIKRLMYFECTRGVGRLAATYLQKYQKSHGLEIGDALVAATARYYKLTLVTSDRKHFPMPDIEMISPLSFQE